PHLLFTSQADTERALDAALARLGGRVERGLELGELRDDLYEGEVAAFMGRSDGTSEELRASWVVGCDGAHSAVRRLAGLEFTGGAYEQDFVLADLVIGWDAPERVYFFLGKGRNAVVLPLADGRSRIIGTSGGPPPPGAADEPSLDELRALFAEVCPFDFVLRDPSWSARFRLHHRGVSRYRAGRLLVAGDAAHIHSPAGGQGMNTGIQDAINLGWKLALVARGEAPATLLDSYDEERRPVGQRLLQFTDRLFSLVTSPNPLVVWARNRLVPLFAPRLMRTPARRKLAFRFVSQLGIHYRGSSLAVGDCGERAPDAMVDGVNHLVDSFKSPLHHLVVFGAGAGFLRAAVGRFAPHLDGVVVDDPIARQRYGVSGDGWALVRPDQYIAARAQSFDDAPLDAYFGARIGISSSKRSM
ncbi:MAG: FAD-dependent monooxygenase, partial [Polyangia bacterium]